ncbi:MAG TPA: hypothetical protein VK132_01575 [Gemmatimonadales bacterium]|nr:hypothetical protein [Gemmatimonadales bacterium]
MLLIAAPAVAQEPPWSVRHLSSRIPREELDAISARGREIAGYDAAAWHGTDVVRALNPPTSAVRGYVARRGADGLWEVVFGRQSANADTFYIAYRATQRAAGETTYVAATFTLPEADTDYFARAARAINLAAHAFGRVTRPYNAVALPIDGSEDWFVYLVPAPTRLGVWPLGADARYRVAADGRTVLEKRRLHNAVIEYGPPPERPGEELKSGWHTALLADRPEDTDVFLVLTRRPRVPEYIVSETFYFRIDADGHITAYDRDPPPK